MSRRLERVRDGRPAAPVRLVHLGVGAFARAHPIWFTEHAGDGWGVAAFTGRSPAVAEDLTAAGGLYTLVIRAPEGDRREVVSAISEAHAGTDLASWRRLLADPAVGVVTTTVTEAGYHRAAGGGLDREHPAVAADLAALRVDPDGGIVETVPGKLLAGLLARRASGAGPVALVPCDNVPGNGAMLRRVVADAAASVDLTLPGWIDAQVSFVSTMVDRITPRTAADDRAGAGIEDPALVVTEPYAEWVLSGDFPAGRPAWEAAGARLVDDVEPFETRKLWLLNGAHSLMAYAGPLRGHTMVAEAIGDPVVRGWVGEWWDLAARHLSLAAEEVDAYRAALLERFANPRIRHLLAQIAADGSQKVPIRIVPALRLELDGSREPVAAYRILAAWICHLRGLGTPVDDVEAEALLAPAASGVPETVAAVLDRLGIAEAGSVAAVVRLVEELDASRRG